MWIYYPICIDKESDIGVFVEIEITITGSYKMIVKIIINMTSKLIKENTIENLSKILE